MNAVIISLTALNPKRDVTPQEVAQALIDTAGDLLGAVPPLTVLPYELRTNGFLITFAGDPNAPTAPDAA